MTLVLDKRGRLKLSEAQIQKQCVDLLRRERWIVRPAPRLGHQKRGGVAYEIPVGEPDLLCVQPGRVLWIEVKATDGRVDKHQKVWHDTSRAVGYEVHVVHSVEELKAVLPTRLRAVGGGE